MDEITRANAELRLAVQGMLLVWQTQIEWTERNPLAEPKTLMDRAFGELFRASVVYDDAHAADPPEESWESIRP